VEAGTCNTADCVLVATWSGSCTIAGWVVVTTCSCWHVDVGESDAGTIVSASSYVGCRTGEDDAAKPGSDS
jgi:hypothetical protein